MKSASTYPFEDEGHAPPARSPSRADGREEILNSGLHAVGLVFVIPAGVELIRAALDSHDPARLVSAWAFALTLAAVYATSTLYHAARSAARKARLQVLDRVAIAGLMAGTYTPIGLLLVRGSLGIGLCAAEWVLFAVGLALSAHDPRRFPERSVWLYQAMGWLTALGFGPLWQHTQPAVLGIFALGGLCYLAGVLCLVRDQIRLMHALSHALALVASACHVWVVWQCLR